MIKTGPLKAFNSRQFRLLWGSSLLSIVSFFMVLVARGWIVLELTDSPFMVTAVNAVPMLPILIAAPVGGIAADRISRRLILIAGDTISCLSVLALGVLVVADAVEVWHIFALSFIQGLAFATMMPARMALVPDVLEVSDMASGVAIFSSVFSAGMFVGPAPAGLLIENFGIGQTFMIAAAMLVPAVAILFGLNAPRPDPGGAQLGQKSIMTDLAEAMSHIRNRPLLLGLVVMGVVLSVVNMPYQAVLPVFARDVLGTGAAGLGYLTAAGGVGALVGSLTVATAGNDRQLRILLIGGVLTFGPFIVAFSISWIFWLSLVFGFLLGLVTQITLTSNLTIMQLAVPNHLRGRVLSIRMIVIGLGPAGMLVLGLGTEILGPRTALGLMGIASFVLTLILVRAFPVMRRAEPDTADAASTVGSIVR